MGYLFDPGNPKVVANGRLYGIAQGGDYLKPNTSLVCVDLTAHKVLWDYETHGRTNVEYAPAMTDDFILFGATDRFLHTVRTDNGESMWKYKTKQPVTAGVATKDGIVCAASADGTLYALNADDGRLAWTFTANGQFRASLCIMEDIVYAGSFDGYLYALRVSDGEMIWKYEIGAPVVGSLSGTGTVLCAVSETNYLYVIGNKE